LNHDVESAHCVGTLNKDADGEVLTGSNGPNGSRAGRTAGGRCGSGNTDGTSEGVSPRDYG